MTGQAGSSSLWDKSCLPGRCGLFWIRRFDVVPAKDFDFQLLAQ